jgi:hypothetical protein
MGVTPPHSPPSDPPLCRTAFVDQATIVDHGEELEVWYVQKGDQFVKAKDLSDAEVAPVETQEDVPPGVIWRRTVELLLPQGTVLMKRVTSPRIQRRDPLDYLTRGNLGTHRNVRESYFRILGNYRIARVSFHREPTQG